MEHSFNKYPIKIQPHGSLVNKILLSSRSHHNSCFERAIIYIYANDDNGSIGFIVNQDLGAFIPEDIFEFSHKNLCIPERLTKKCDIRFGGPFETNKLLVIALNPKEHKKQTPASRLIIHNDLEEFIADYVYGTYDDKFAIIRGVCLWESQQLEEEVAQNNWIVMDLPGTDIIFSKNTNNKWQKMLARIGVGDPTNITSYTGSA